MIIHTCSSQRALQKNKTVTSIAFKSPHHCKSRTDYQYTLNRFSLMKTMDKKQPIRLSLFKNEKLRIMLADAINSNDDQCNYKSCTKTKSNLVFLPILGVTTQRIVLKAKNNVSAFKTKEEIRQLYTRKRCHTGIEYL